MLQFPEIFQHWIITISLSVLIFLGLGRLGRFATIKTQFPPDEQALIIRVTNIINTYQVGAKGDHLPWGTKALMITIMKTMVWRERPRIAQNNLIIVRSAFLHGACAERDSPISGQFLAPGWWKVGRRIQGLCARERVWVYCEKQRISIYLLIWTYCCDITSCNHRLRLLLIVIAIGRDHNYHHYHYQ